MTPEENKAASTSAYHAGERKKSNLAFAFFCMGKDRARDMEIFYAFCRLMDDIADEEVAPVEERRKSLDWWTEEIGRACSDDVAETALCPLGVEMRGLIRRRNIRKDDVLEIIEGVRRDTFDEEFKTFEDIRKYCHGVACAVGLVSICIFGCKSPKAREFAEALGYALQFTNILRDVRDDLKSHDRIYIPASELSAFGLTKEELRNPEGNENARALFKMMWFRAKHFFNRAERLLPEEDRRALAPALIMRNIYGKILDSLAELNFAIPDSPLKISKAKKIALALSAIRDSKRTGGAEKSGVAFGRAAVFGAGIAGSCAALRLALEGFDVTLIEASSHPMGRAADLQWGGARLDNGTHAVMGCYENFFKYAKMLGTDNTEVFEPISRLNFLFAKDNGKFKAGESVVVDFPKSGFFAKTFSSLSYLRVAGGFRNMLLMASLKFGLGKPKLGETAAQFLSRKKISDDSIEAFWKPFCLSALNTKIEETDAELLVKTLRKSSLKGGKNGEIIFPKNSISSRFWDRTKVFLESVGSEVRFSESAKKLVIEGGKITGYETSKGAKEKCDIAVCALPPKAAAKLFSESELSLDISGIAQRDITNIYFETNKSLIDGNAACIVGSNLQWIFDHTGKKCTNDGKRLYGITVSASDFSGTAEETKTAVLAELNKIFGDIKTEAIFVGKFTGATIGADTRTESARPLGDTAIKNLKLVGDWIQTGLPCTMESAAKSASDMKI